MVVATVSIALAGTTPLRAVAAPSVPARATAVSEQQQRDALISALETWTAAASPIVAPAAITIGDTIANQPPPGVIDTIAGQIGSGFTGDGGPSTDALLSGPSGFIFDPDGNLFVADQGNLRVRKIDATTGVITTVAGGGEYQTWVDNGPATSAYLTNPQGVAIGPDGDLYIADIGGSKIRRVDVETGIISTVAGSGGAFCCTGYSGDGGPATAATLRQPYDVAVAPNGDLYIADMANQVIRKVDAATGIITTFAGVGSPAAFGGDGGPAIQASFYNPRSLALTDDALYVADSGNGRVRRIDLVTGIITTIAGNSGGAGAVIDGRPAVAGALIRPYTVAVDLDGDLYIAENGMSRIRRVDITTGIISTVVGTSTGDCGDGGPSIQACIYTPRAVAVAPNGVLALDSQSRVALVTPAPPPDPVTSPTLTFARGNCCAPNRLVAGWTPPATPINRVRVVTSPGGVSTTVAGATAEAHIPGLQDGERYTAVISATNGWGWSTPVVTPPATFGNAVPFDRFDPGAESDPAITQADFVNGYLLAIASKAVYGDPEAPEADQEAVIEGAFTSLGLRGATYVDEPSTDTQFVVGRRGNSIVVTFRGTAGFDDMIVDAQTGQFGFDTSVGPVWAHNGFALALLSVYDRVRAELDTIRGTYPDASIVLTGHSLGGALAELAALRLRDDGYPIAMVHTIGAPNLGGAQLTQAYDDLGLSPITHRWVNDHDVVPMAFDVIPGYTEVGRTHVFARGVTAPTLDATSQPVGQFGFFDHDVAIYAENLRRQIVDTTLLPAPPARLTDPLNSFDTETLMEETIAWAAGIGARADDEIAGFLTETEATFAQTVPILVAFLDDLLGLDRVVAILESAYAVGAETMATALASVIGEGGLMDLARALLDEYGLDSLTLTDVLLAAGFDPVAVAATVTALFDAVASDLTGGLNGLADQLAEWAEAFGFDGDAALLPTDLETLFDLDGALAALTFPVIDPSATAAEAAVVLEQAGWDVDWFTGGTGALAPPTGDDLVQVRRTITIGPLASLATPVRPTADGLLDGLADTLSLTATGGWDGTVTVDLLLGADTAGFYLDPSTSITLDVDGSVAVADNETVAGVTAAIVGAVSADVTATTQPSGTGRVRPGPGAPGLATTLDGRIDTSLAVDLGDIQLDWAGAWQIEATSGTASATLLPGATLAGEAVLPIVEPASTVALAGTFLGVDGWSIEGGLTGAPTAAGLTVTSGTLNATLTPTAFAGTARLALELAIATGAPVAGELVVDWSPSGTQLAGSMRLDGAVAAPVARFDGITLQFATTGAGTTIELISDPAGTITLFPDTNSGAGLLTIEQPVGSLTTDGVLTIGAESATALIAGEVVLAIDDPTIVLDPDAPTPSPIVTLPAATATIPSLGDISVTFENLQLMNDGTVRVSAATADPGQITDTLGIAGILPFHVTHVAIAFPDPSQPLDRFDATVTGTFDFDALSDLPFTPILTIGDRQVDATSPDADQVFTFTVRADSLSSGEIRPIGFGPITIGFADLNAGPLTLGAAITLGRYDSDGALAPPDGFSTGEISGWMSVVATGNGLSGSIEATVTGSLDITPTASVLDLDATIVASGSYDDVFELEDLSLSVSMRVRADGDGVSLERFDVDDVTVKKLSVAFGGLVRLTVRDASLTGGSGGFALAPSPGTNWITISGTPEEPGAQIELIGAEFEGWGGSIGNVALRADDAGDGSTIIVPVLLPGFYADLRLGDDATLGFPEWLPLRFRNAGLTFPTLSPADLANGVELTPDLLAGMRVRVSASLDGNDTFPITGAVEGLEVDLGLLAAGEFPVTNLDAAMFGVEPFDLGPMTVGGGLGLGLLEIDADDDGIVDDRVFFARVFGEFAYSGFGAGVDLVITQYGPVLAKVSAPTPIPLGNTGLMLAGVRGGIRFGGEGLVPPGDPRDLLGDPRYDLDFPITLDVIRESVMSCVDKNAGRTGTPNATWPCFTWNDGGTVTIGTTLTSYAAPGVVSADLNGAIDLRFVRDAAGDLVVGDNGLPVPPALRFAATGTVNVWSIGIADTAVLVAFDDPMAPTLDMAAQMPGLSGPIGFIIPASGTYEVHVGTDGIAAGAIEATRILLESVSAATLTGSQQLFSDALDELAASLQQARTLTDASGAPLPRASAERVAPYRPLASALLDLDGNGKVGDDEVRAIDRGFLLDRLLGGNRLPPLLPEIDLDAVANLPAIADSLAPVLRGLQTALIAEAQRLASQAPSSYDLGSLLADPEVATYTPAGLAFVDLMQQAVTDGIRDGATAWAAVFDPVVRIEGGIQPVIAGVPFGEPTDKGTFTIGRDQIGFGLSGSVESLFLSVWGGIGIASAELNKVFGVNSIVAVEGTLALPDVFAAVAQGNPMVLDPFDADWNVQLSMTSKVAGFTLQESRGVLIPPDLDLAQLRMLVCRVDRPDIAPCGGDLIPVDGDEHWAAIQQFGGLILSHELLTPRVAADPGGVLADLHLDPPDEWLGWFDLIQHNFAAVTALYDVGSYQIFIPSLQGVLDPSYVADKVWPTSGSDLERLGFTTVEAAFEAAESVKGAFFAEGMWDVQLLGLPLANGVISVDDDSFEVDAAFPMFGNVPVTVQFGGVTVTAGSQQAALPVPGFDVTLTGDHAADALAGFDLPAAVALDTGDTLRLQAYGPGYDPTSTSTLQRDGGVQVDATLDLDGLVDGARFTLAVVGTDPATADLHGSAQVDTLGPFAGVTITDATITLDRVGGAWSVGIAGDAATPLGNGTVDATLDGTLAGSMTVALDGGGVDLGGFRIDLAVTITSQRTARGELTFTSELTGTIDLPALGWSDVVVDGALDAKGLDRLTIGASEATLGPVQLTDGSFELRRTGNGWSLVVAATATVPGVLDALLVNGDLAPDGTGSLAVSSTGALRLGIGTEQAVTLTGPTATLVRTNDQVSMNVAGDVTVLDVALQVSGQLAVGTAASTGNLTASTPPAGVPFGTATLHGTFTLAVRSTATPPFGLPAVTAAVSFAGSATVPGIASGLAVSGTISSTGTTTLTVAATSLTIDGFTLTDGTFTLRRTPLAPVGVGFSTTLTVDAQLSVLGVTADVAGTISVGAAALTGNLALSTATPYALGLFQLTGGFTLELGSSGAALGVTSKLSVPGLLADATVTGTLDWSTGQNVQLVGSLTVAAPTWMPLGGTASALRLGGSMTLTRFAVGSGSVTQLGVTGGSLNWFGVDTFELPSFAVGSDGSFDVVADADTVTIGTFTLGLPSIAVHVGANGAGSELRMGSASLSITGISPSISVPGFDVSTTGDFAIDLPGLASLGIGGYGVHSGAATFRFERVAGVFRFRLAGAGSLGVPGLPSPITLDSFQLATNGTVTAGITVKRIGPAALSIRNATIGFTRTATTGPTLTVAAGMLHLPVGETITLPNLTFDVNGELSTPAFNRALTLGPGFTVPSTSGSPLPLRLVAKDGVLTLEQTAPRNFSLPLGSSLTLTDFKAGSNGTFSGKVTGTVSPLGYNLTNASFTISKPATWVDARVQLDTPLTVSFGLASSSVTGWFATNGRFQFTSTVAIPQSDRANLFNPGQFLGVSGSASILLTNTGMTGTFSGQMSIPFTCTAQMSGSIDATGTLVGSFLCDPSGPSSAFYQSVEVKLFSPLPVGNDTVKPSIAPIDDITFYAAAPTPVYFTVKASDDRDDSPTVTCRNPAGTVVTSGSSFPAGPTVVTCIAADDASPANVSAPRTFTVTVIALTTIPVSINGRSVADGDGTVPLPAGAATNVSAGGFAASSPVMATLHSTPIPVGTALADDDGTVTFTFTMPGVDAGLHHLELTGVAPDGGDLHIVIPVVVEADPDDPTNPCQRPSHKRPPHAGGPCPPPPCPTPPRQPHGRPPHTAPPQAGPPCPLPPVRHHLAHDRPVRRRAHVRRPRECAARRRIDGDRGPVR